MYKQNLLNIKYITFVVALEIKKKENPRMQFSNDSNDNKQYGNFWTKRITSLTRSDDQSLEYAALPAVACTG